MSQVHQVPAQVKQPTMAELIERVAALEAKVADLQKPAGKSEREMTDDDARSVLNGAHKDLKHNEAAKTLNLSYGQVYSCRLEYTFKAIHKELKDAGFKNPWKK